MFEWLNAAHVPVARTHLPANTSLALVKPHSLYLQGPGVDTQGQKQPKMPSGNPG